MDKSSDDKDLDQSFESSPRGYSETLSNPVEVNITTSVLEVTGFKHSFERARGSNENCIVCRESVSKQAYLQCSVCNSVVHQKCIPRVLDSCRVPTTLYFLGKNSDHFAQLHLEEQRYLQRVRFTHVESTLVGISDLGEAYTFQISNNPYEQTIKLQKSFDFQRSTVLEVCAGASFTLFLTGSGHVYSYGRNTEGQLGLGTEIKDSSVPQMIPEFLGKKIVKICCGGTHAIALTSKNEIYTWGAGKNGRLGNGTQDNLFSPRQVELKYPSSIDQDTTDIKIACGWSHSMILLLPRLQQSQSYLFTFGKGDFGQLGHGSKDNELRPRLIEDIVNLRIVHVDGGYYHSAFLTEDGQVYCFGFGGEGQCGQGDTENLYVPKAVTKLTKTVASLYCGSFNNMAITTSDETWVWGRVGSNNYTIPTIVVELNAQIVKRIDSGMFQNLAIVRGSEQKKKPLINSRSVQDLGLTNSGGRARKQQEKVDSMNRNHLIRIVLMQQVVTIYEKENQVLYKEADDRLDAHKQHLIKQQKFRMLKTRLDVCRESLQVKHQVLEEEKRKVDRLREQVAAKLKKLEESKSDLVEKKEKLASKQNILETNKFLYTSLKKHIEVGKLKLLRELKNIYPIVQVRNGEFTIGGLPLPNLPLSEEMSHLKDPYPKHDKEVVSAALGYVCHLLSLISNYTQTPLKYEIAPMGSRSVIVDCISNKGDQVYKCPLYATNKMEYFHYATVLLNTNIEQMLETHHIDICGLGHTLPNLQRLLEFFDHYDGSTLEHAPTKKYRGKSTSNQHR